MSSRKSQNSVLFLATLGVYLGLVLTGATPVLGHAANTRQFDIRDEIEFSDEFDNKPDNETYGLAISLKGYLEDVESFLESLEQLSSGGKFDRAADVFEVSQNSLLPCVPANSIGNYTAVSFSLKNESLQPSLERFSKLLTDGYSLADCVPSSRFNGGEAAESRFTVRLEKAQLSVEIGVRKGSPQLAQKLSADLTKAFAAFRDSGKSSVRVRILKTTSFRAENDQVFVITRLPRAALDPHTADAR
jgi:hypothetical protein